MSNKEVKPLETKEELVAGVTVSDEGKVTISEEVVAKHIESYGTTLDAVKTSQEVVSKVVLDIAAAMGKTAVDHLAKDEKAEKVAGEFNVGHQTNNLVVHRSHEVPVSAVDRSKGTRTVHGYTEVNSKTYQVKAHRDSLRKSIAGYASTKLPN